jgi:hypothetical protein
MEKTSMGQLLKLKVLGQRQQIEKIERGRIVIRKANLVIDLKID